MALDFIEVGSVPTEEPCLCPNERTVYLRQLRRMFPKATLGIKRFNDGEYSEVVAYYEVDNRDALEAALDVEANTPSHWDSRAKQELKALYELA